MNKAEAWKILIEREFSEKDFEVLIALTTIEANSCTPSVNETRNGFNFLFSDSSELFIGENFISVI